MSTENRNLGLFSVDELDDQSDSNDSLEAIIASQSKPVDQSEANNTTEETAVDSLVSDENTSEVSDNQLDINEQTDSTEDTEEFSYQTLLDTFYQEGILPNDLEIPEDVDDSFDGFKTIVNKGLEVKLNKVLEERDSRLSEETKKRIAIELSGGSIQELYGDQEPIDYNSIAIDESDIDDNITAEDIIDNQKSLYFDYLQSLGKFDEAKIKALVEESEISGTLKSQAEIAKVFLASRDEQKLKEYIESKKAQEEADKVARIKAEEDFKNYVLNLREVGQFQIDKNKSQKLYDFLTKRDKDGKTESEKRFTKENALLFEYFLMEGFDKIDTFKKQAQTEATLKLKKTLHKFKPNTSVNALSQPAEKETADPRSVLQSLFGKE